MRWEAWSDDGGETWTDLTVSTILPDGPLDPAGGCLGGLVRLPVCGRDVLLYSNCDSPSGRKDMAVWASFDGGKTWPIKRRVFDGPCAYSSLNAGRPARQAKGGSTSCSRAAKVTSMRRLPGPVQPELAAGR